MAVLEPTFLQSKELPLALKQAVLAPELASVGYPTSPLPNPSVISLQSPVRRHDSGFGCCSRSLSPSTPNPSLIMDFESLGPVSRFPSHHFIATMGNGFSLGIIDCDKGSLQQLAVPIPHQQLLDDPSIDLASFTLAQITTVSIIGEGQLWAGTANGSLHCFDLSPELRLKNHTFININEPILCITSRPVECIFPAISQPNYSLPMTSLTTEILIGLPYGYIIVLTGEADSRGHLKTSIDKLSSRRIVRFTNSPVDCAVNCIVHVISDELGECYWCGCGGSVFILSSSSWKRLKQIRPTVSSPAPDEKMEISQLLSTEVGVWGYMSGLSSVYLWDKTDHSLKLLLNYCSTRRTLQLKHETSCLHYMHPFLFVGTRQGDLIVFKIKETISTTSPPKDKPTSPSQHKTTTATTTTYDYRFISSTHISTQPILNILTTTCSSSGISRNVLSSVPPTPTSSAINVLVLEGAGGANDRSKIQTFELSLSPSLSLCSSPLSDITIMSNNSLRNSLTLTPNRRLSIVGSASSDYVPLKNN